MTQPPTVAQLRNLTDRAGMGLTPGEQKRLREGLDALHAERTDARQKFADVCAQRDRLRLRMNTLADRWETALPGQPHHGFAEALRAEISIEPLPPTRAEAADNRVRALAGRWAKAGPPPLGTPLARWWDKRLAELNTALDEPAPAATQATDEQG